MTTQKPSYIKLFWQLLKTDFHIYKKSVIDAMIDAVIWFICLTAVFAYIFPSIGISQDFSILIVVGAVASCIYWDVWATATSFIIDIEGSKTIGYFLTLPIPNVLVLIKQILVNAIKAGLPALIILPIGKLLLWNTLQFTNFSIVKFTLIFILTSLFGGSFSLFIVSRVKDINHIGKVAMRFLFPLWFFGGSNYSFAIIQKLSPTFAYASLANPLLYAMEGVRAAVLGQQGYLAFPICLLMLTLFTIIFAFLGIVSLKKRLDFV